MCRLHLQIREGLPRSLKLGLELSASILSNSERAGSVHLYLRIAMDAFGLLGLGSIWRNLPNASDKCRNPNQEAEEEQSWYVWDNAQPRVTKARRLLKMPLCLRGEVALPG